MNAIQLLPRGLVLPLIVLWMLLVPSESQESLCSTPKQTCVKDATTGSSVACYPLIAGGVMDSPAGTVCVQMQSSGSALQLQSLQVLYKAAAGWSFQSVHAWAGVAGEYPQHAANGSPLIENFPAAATSLQTTQVSVTVALVRIPAAQCCQDNNIYTSKTYSLAAHAVMIGPSMEPQTAWSLGPPLSDMDTTSGAMGSAVTFSCDCTDDDIVTPAPITTPAPIAPFTLAPVKTPAPVVAPTEAYPAQVAPSAPFREEAPVVGPTAPLDVTDKAPTLTTTTTSSSGADCIIAPTDTKCFQMLSGQTYNLGQVCVHPNNLQELTITYNTASQYYLLAIHTWTGTSNDYPTTAAGNPIYDDFPSKEEFLAMDKIQTASVVLPLDKVCNWTSFDVEYMLLAHMAVADVTEVEESGGGIQIQTQTAWSEGSNVVFDDAAGKLGSYSVFEISCTCILPPTKSPTLTPTTSPSLHPSSSPSVLPSLSPSVEPSNDPTLSPSSSPSDGPTVGPTFFPTEPPTTRPSAPPTDPPTKSPSTSPSSTPSAGPSGAPSTSPSSTPSAGPSGTPSTSPSSTPSGGPTGTPTTSPTSSPSAGPTETPTTSPTLSPSSGPTGTPTTSPTLSPSSGPTGTPTAGPTPTVGPSSAPSAMPTESPTLGPSLSPSAGPTQTPTLPPTSGPTESPTLGPSLSPSAQPTESPTSRPTASPSAGPTDTPTTRPTLSPSVGPTDTPTAGPSLSPSATPTDGPTKSPSSAPSTDPTWAPSKHPSSAPSTDPTAAPTKHPSSAPTKSPTAAPTKSPTESPTTSPTVSPTASPTASPTESPTSSPTSSPTQDPTAPPTFAPIDTPTDAPADADCDVAYLRCTNGVASFHCFQDLHPTTLPWGWVQQIETFDVECEIWARATGCDLDLGVMVGIAFVDAAAVHVMLGSGYTAKSMQLYVGTDMFPSNSEDEVSVDPNLFSYDFFIQGTGSGDYIATFTEGDYFIVHFDICNMSTGTPLNTDRF